MNATHRPPKPRGKSLNGLLTLACGILLGCGGAPIGAHRPVADPTQSGLNDRSPNTGFALKSVEVIDLKREAFREISQFDPYQGLARLSDGRCVELPRTRATGAQTVAVLVEGTAGCETLPGPATGLAGLPCSGAVQSSQVGNWRLKCDSLASGDSALVAVGASPSNLGRNVTLAVLDQRIRLFKVFIVHPGIADVTTLGWRNDDRAAISSFVWIASTTKAEDGTRPSRTAN